MTTFSKTAKRSFVNTATVSSVILLSACGGSGTSRASFSELRADYIRLNDAIDFENLSAADIYEAGDLPTTGGQTYNGVMTILIDSDAVPGSSENILLLGDLRLTTNFQKNTIGGGVDDFSDGSGDTFGGSVDFSGGTINRGATGLQDAFSANADGTITSNDAGGSIDINGRIGGAFVGDNYEHIAGGFEGSVGPFDIGFDGSDDGVSLFIGER